MSNRFLLSLIVTVATGWVIFAACGASTGLFSIDELIYQGMIDAFTRDRSLAVENGYAEYPSGALKLVMLVESSGRLLPQYPSGWALVASPAYDLLGLRGVLLMNAVAAVTTLVFVWIAARAVLDDGRLASATTLLYALATFAVDYAFGIWPHSIATCFVMAALAATTVGWRSDGAREAGAMLVAGLAIGIGANFRTDSVLALPALALWVLSTFRMPFRALLALGAGLAPGLLAAAGLNLAKFGVLSPVSYGRQGAAAGATSVDYYAPILPFVAVVSVASLALGFERVRLVVLRPWRVALAVLTVVLIVIAVPEFAVVVRRIATGIYVLVVDMQAYTDTRAAGVERVPDGTYRFWGLAKKSLLQSAPYIAGCLVLCRALVREGPGRSLWLCVIFCATWVLPFAFGQWHGGLANNMRYFGPMLAPLCILAIAAVNELRSLPTDWRVALGAAVVSVLAAAVVPIHGGHVPFFVWHNAAPGGLALILAVLSLVLLSNRVRARWPVLAASAWRGVFVACVAAAAGSAYYFDLSISQSRRAQHEANRALFADVPAHSLVLTFMPEAAGFRLNSPPSMTAQADYRRRTLDAGLVRYAFRSGRRVFVQGSELASLAQSMGLASQLVPRYGIELPFELFELRNEPPAGREMTLAGAGEVMTTVRGLIEGAEHE